MERNVTSKKTDSRGVVSENHQPRYFAMGVESWNLTSRDFNFGAIWKDLDHFIVLLARQFYEHFISDLRH